MTDDTTALRTRITELETANAATSAKLARLEAWQAATIAGLNADAFVPLAIHYDLRFKIENNAAHVRVGESGNWQPLADAVKAEPLKAFAPSLLKSGAQDPAAAASAVDSVLGVRRERANEGNPLRPAVATGKAGQ